MQRSFPTVVYYPPSAPVYDCFLVCYLSYDLAIDIPTHGRWVVPDKSSPRTFCDYILNIELLVLTFHSCTTHFQMCKTLMHRSASRGRREPNFTAKKKSEKPRFKDIPLNYMHTQKTSVGTPDFFPHFPYLKDYHENLPVGLSLGSSPSGRGTCLTLTSAVCLQVGRCFHPHSRIENQSCSQLSAKSLSRIENFCRTQYLTPIFSFHFVNSFSHLLILTPWDILI